MASISKANNPVSLANLEIEYKEGRERAVDTSYEQLLDIVTTTSDSKRVLFHGSKGRLRRWRGERQPQGFEEYSYMATLDKWEYTETVPKDVLDDDQTGGALRRKVGEFGEAVNKSLAMETWENLRLFQFYDSWDKLSFFNEAHVYKNTKGQIVNPVGVSYSYANMELAGTYPMGVTGIAYAQAHFAGLKDDKGKKLGARLTHVVVARGSDYARIASEIANSTYVIDTSGNRGANINNAFRGQFEIIETDYALGASEWMALDLSDPSMKPITLLTHTVSPGYKNLEYSQLLEDSQTGFWLDELAFGVKGRFDWNPGDPRTVFLFGSSSVTAATFVTDLERQRPFDVNA